MIDLVLLLSFGTLENVLGKNVAQVFGANIMLIGLVALIVMMAFLIKIGAGFETSAVLGLFFFFMLTSRGITGGGNSSVASFIPDIGLVVGILIGSLVVWMAFFRQR